MNPNTRKDKTTGSGMILTSRDQHIVNLVAGRGAVTREQITKAAGFGSVARTNAVLLRLTRHHYLSVRFQPTLKGNRRHVYTLGAAGAELLAEPNTSPRRFRECSDLFLEHRLGINDVWVAFLTANLPAYELVDWRSEQQLAKLSLGLIPDGFAEYLLSQHSYTVFVEVDRGTETLARFDRKVEAYLKLTLGGQFQNIFSRRFFRVLVVAPSVARLENIRSVIRKRTDRVFWLTTRDELVASGPFATIWRRPATSDLQSLIS